MKASPALPRKPEARTESVEDLVLRVRSGVVRVPRFQRGLKWQSTNVVELFDSIYRGYPIGSLLFYKRAANAARLYVGPVAVDAPEATEAWWVVDGQQRLTSLTACLLRSVPLPTKPSRGDPFVVYFDAERRTFEPPTTTGQIASTWVPLPNLIDATRLSEWIFQWQHSSDEALRRAVFEAGARIREYSVPLYLIEGDDSEVSKQIYYRVNSTGKSLEWTDVHKALFGDEEAAPSTLEELSTSLAEVGMGRFEEKRLLTCLLALRGKDPTRSLADHIQRDSEVLRHGVRDALPVLRRVLTFLRRDAGIVHLRLLPKSILLDVLTRFLALHSDPRPRTRLLLARWVWRCVLGAGAFDDRTLRRRGIAAVSAAEEESVQALLALVHKERPGRPAVPASFDARADASRIVLLALAHLRPRALDQGEPIDIAEQLEQGDKAAFVRILRQRGLPGGRSPANRIIESPGIPALRLLRERIDRNSHEDPVLASHAIDATAARCLAAGDVEGFLTRRTEALSKSLDAMSERMAAWDHSDRPSVEHFLKQAGVES